MAQIVIMGLSRIARGLRPSSVVYLDVMLWIHNDRGDAYGLVVELILPRQRGSQVKPGTMGRGRIEKWEARKD